MTVVLVLPYANAATCDCHERIAEAEHCHTSESAAVTMVSMDHHCDAMMACCLINLGQVLNNSVTVSDESIDEKANADIPTILSAVIQAPPDPPPRV